MPATATTTEHLTLVQAARLIFPHARGNSGYHRLRMIIARHHCPVQFSYGRGAKGREARYLRADQVAALQAWVKELS
jgi:hypothetical protein